MVPGTMYYPPKLAHPNTYRQPLTCSEKWPQCIRRNTISKSGLSGPLIGTIIR